MKFEQLKRKSIPAGQDLRVRLARLEVLDTFHSDGRLGGRVGIGHGQVRADLTVDVHPSTDELPDWRAVLDQNRSEILTALQGLA